MSIPPYAAQPESNVLVVRRGQPLLIDWGDGPIEVVVMDVEFDTSRNLDRTTLHYAIQPPARYQGAIKFTFLKD